MMCRGLLAIFRMLQRTQWKICEGLEKQESNQYKCTDKRNYLWSEKLCLVKKMDNYIIVYWVISGEEENDAQGLRKMLSKASLILFIPWDKVSSSKLLSY